MNLEVNVHEEENLQLMTAGLMDTMKTMKFFHHIEVLLEMLHQMFSWEIQLQNNL